MPVDSCSRWCFRCLSGLFFGSIPALEVHAPAQRRRWPRRGAHGERAAASGSAVAQRAGGGAGGHGAGAAGERRAHDSHAGGAAQRRSGLCGCQRMCETMRIAIPEPLIADRADDHAHREQHCRQAGRDSRSELCGICAATCPWTASSRTGTRFSSRARTYANEEPAAASVQLRLARILPYRGNAHYRRPRLYLDRHLWAAGQWESFRRTWRASRGDRRRRPSASISAIMPSQPWHEVIGVVAGRAPERRG